MNKNEDTYVSRKKTDLVRGEIHLQPPNNGNPAAAGQEADEELERHTLEKYTFSNALALSGSVQLNFTSIHFLPFRHSNLIQNRVSTISCSISITISLVFSRLA